MTGGRWVQYFWAITTLIVFITNCASPVSSQGADITYTIDEEEDPDVQIGDIENNLGLRNTMESEDYSKLVYSILSTGNAFAEYFRVDNKSGILYTQKPLDRDTLSSCAFTTTCSVGIDVAATGGGFFRQISISIIIRDINDNYPEFKKSVYSVEFLEGSGRDTNAAVDGASDIDAGNNTVQNYYISTPDVPFDVTFEKVFDGTTDVKIVVTGELDRETKDFYQLTLVAEDFGNPKKTGEVKVNVTINDFNDNDPEFEKEFYNVTVDEDIANNSVILTVTATDADLGKNGEVFYRLSSTQQPGIPELFAINSENGELRVIGQLVYDSTEKLWVNVEASDKGVPPNVEKVQVFVNVIDSSNNPPTILLNVLQGGVITEYANVGSVVAQITVIDGDTSKNGRVNCHAVSDNFRLERIKEKQYKAVVWKPLNRELLDTHSISVTCIDEGVPPLNASIEFKVTVSDENDNPPRFTQGTYFAEVPENNHIGRVVAHVSATDIDEGKNAKIRYSLVDTEGYEFWIDEVSGEIRANFKMDRENVTKITIEVMAEDEGSPKLANSAQVILTISDINDNRPNFTLPNYQFFIYEGVPFNTTVDQLTATDLDDGDNGIVSFSFDVQPSSSFPFILFSDGTIKMIRGLDRETVSKYEFPVVASDQGEPPLSSSVTVTVLVLDINDNSPVFSFPNTVNNTVSISLSTAIDSVIATVKASDLDDGDNGAVSYTIIDNNVSTIFRMENADNGGNIRLLRIPSASEAVSLTFRVQAADSGTPRLSSVRSLTVAFTKAHVPEDSSKQNFLIAVAVSCVTVVLSVAIVLTICLIRRHDRQKNKDEPDRVVEARPTDSKQSMTDSRESLKKVSFSMDFNSSLGSEKSRDTSHAPLVNQDVYKISENGRSPSTLSSPRSVEYHQMPDADVQQLDPAKVLQLHRSLLQSHDHLWANHRDDHTPPLTKEILKRHEDAGSESSGETATCDSGRGGSESDIQTSYTSQSHDTDHIKTVKFANKPLLHHISQDQNWKNPRDFSTNSQYAHSDSLHNSSVNNMNMKNNRLPVPRRDYHGNQGVSSQFHAPRHGYSLSPIQDTSSVGFGTSYDDDDDTTTSGSYTIDHEDWDRQSQTRYNLSHNEAYC